MCFCLQGKGRLHFVQEKSKVYANYYVNELLPKLMDDCHHFARPIFHISARWSTCACSKTDPTMACSSLSRLNRQGRTASKQPGFKSAAARRRSSVGGGGGNITIGGGVGRRRVQT